MKMILVIKYCNEIANEKKTIGEWPRLDLLTGPTTNTQKKRSNIKRNDSEGREENRDDLLRFLIGFMRRHFFFKLWNSISFYFFLILTHCLSLLQSHSFITGCSFCCHYRTFSVCNRIFVLLLYYSSAYLEVIFIHLRL